MNYTITEQDKREAYAALAALGFTDIDTTEAPKLETIKDSGWIIKTDYHSTVFVITPEGKQRQLFNQQADEIIDALQDGFTWASTVIDIISDFIGYEPLELAA